MTHLFFLQCEVKPAPGSELFAEVGGAVVNCFVATESEAKAQELVLANFKENGWEVVSIEDEPHQVEREKLEEPEWLECFDQAAQDGECYVYHQWPPEPQEDDALH